MHSNFLGWLKKFGPAQNILGPVKGQGINFQIPEPYSNQRGGADAAHHCRGCTKNFPVDIFLNIAYVYFVPIV